METDWVPLQREVFEGLSSCSDASQVLRRAEKIGKIATGLFEDLAAFHCLV
jgi:hypothetical protein